MSAGRVLVITYSWPPKGGVSVMRAVKFVKYLTRLGWSAVVLTTDEGAPGTSYGREDVNIGSLPKVIRTPYLKKAALLPDRIRQNILFPDLYVGWCGYAVKAAFDLLDSEKIDIIFSTSPPETSHLIARRIKETTGLPWVADMRDLWSEDLFRPRNILSRYVSKIFEKRILRHADAVVTVTEGWAQALARTSGLDGRRIKVIENGYDEEDFNIPGTTPSRFTIVYAGKMHRVYQDPGIFFRALNKAVGEGLIDRDKIAVKFYVFGRDAADISGMTKIYGLEDIVETCGRIDYPETIRALVSSSALLFVPWKGRPGEAWHSAKVFDYIGSGRPILAVGDKMSSASRLVESLRCGLAAGDVEEVKDAMVRYYREFRSSGRVDLKNADRAGIASCTRLGRAKELAAIFDGLLKK